MGRLPGVLPVTDHGPVVARKSRVLEARPPEAGLASVSASLS
jgi:hypothetical protein